MRYVTSHLISWSVIITMGLTLSATAAAGENYPDGHGNITNGENIFKNGKGDKVPACISCHGENGTGSDDIGAPRLAGQYYSFLIKQLHDFATNRRKDDIAFTMNLVASNLSDQDKIDVATYLAQLRVAFPGSDVAAMAKNGQIDKPGDIAKGKSLVKWGESSRGIPACKSCHGYNGRGAPPLFPMIGQQRYAYIVSQLKSWRKGAQESLVPDKTFDGTLAFKHGENKLGWLSPDPEAVCKEGRCNDPMAAMRKIAVMLTDDDIANAAAYLTQATPYPAGDVMTPYPELVKAGERLEYDPNTK
jgi:cytochrome c553